MLRQGDRVWYWARRKGEKPHRKFGVIVFTDANYARVELDGTPSPITVQTVAVRRLHGFPVHGRA